MTQLGKYELHEVIGRGGFGTVYRAIDTSLGREVALKVLHPQLTTDPDFLEKFRNEARLVAALDSPHIVTIYDFGEADGRVFIAMKYFSGGSLKQKLEQEGALPFDQALQIFQQVCLGLQTAHKKGLIHRDIKPGNILFDAEGNAVIGDFGLARAIQQSSTSAASSGGGVGTPAYRAPELWRGKPPASPATDIYSLGCVLSEMLTGKVLFDGETPDEILTKHLIDGTQLPENAINNAPSGICDVIIKATSKEQQNRYTSVSELLNDLSGLRADISSSGDIDTNVGKEERSSTIGENEIEKKLADTSSSRNDNIKVSFTPISDKEQIQEESQKLNRKYIWIGAIGLTIVGLIICVSLLRKNQNPTSASDLPNNREDTVWTAIQNGISNDSTNSDYQTLPSNVESIIEEPVNIHSNNATTFIKATSSSIDTLDPALAYDTSSGEVIQNVYETLFVYNGISTSEFKPLLALEVPTIENGGISEDGLTWTFKIRQNVKFSDGSVLTPSDVAYTFQRGLLQGGYISPQWLLSEAFFGTGFDDVSLLVDPNGSSSDDRELLLSSDPDTLETVCERVKNAIIADDNNGTVTFYLAQPWSPLLNTLVNPLGSILDKEWVKANGGWDGSCSTWQNYYAMQSDEDPISRLANGTGPFKIESITDGEIILVRNDLYWNDLPKLEKVELVVIPDASTRLEMLTAGDVDMAEISSDSDSQADAYTGSICEYDLDRNSFKACSVLDNDLPLRKITGFSVFSQDVILYNFLIQNDGANPMVGSGRLDGAGIPSDFFSDIHIRKAFSYCFDWDDYISKLYDGEAIQSLQLIPPGMIGFDNNPDHYSKNLDLCTEEFKKADLDHDGIEAGDDTNGDVWNTGFYIQLAYNEGNSSREGIAQILSANLSAVNPNFEAIPTKYDWTTYLEAQRAHQIPVMTAGWWEDIHDPLNWYVPYTIGTYANRQNMPEDLRTEFGSLIDQATNIMDYSKRESVYFSLGQLYFDQVPGIPLVICGKSLYIQRWVSGYLANPILSGTYFYPIYKQ